MYEKNSCQIYGAWFLGVFSWAHYNSQSIQSMRKVNDGKHVINCCELIFSWVH